MALVSRNRPLREIVSTSWTPERIAEVARLAATGDSASMIGAAVGAGRNSIVGVCFRNGIRLCGHAHAHAPKSDNRLREARERGNNLAARIHQKALVQAEARRKAMKAEAKNQPAQRRQIGVLDLRFSMCRWPIGDPQQPAFTFCGERAEGPYCSHHHGLAYQQTSSAKELTRALRRYV